MAEHSQLQFVWKQITEKAENIIPLWSYRHLFKDLEPVDIAGRKIVLKCPSEINAITISTKFAEDFRTAIVKSECGVVDFRLYVEGSDTFTLEAEEDAFETFQASPINPKFTFDSFVVGPGSKLAYAAAKAVAESPGEAFNPLFIYGESGLGKTHLMHAIANEIEKKMPQKKVLYTT